MHTLVKYLHPFLPHFDEKSRSEAQKKNCYKTQNWTSQAEDRQAMQSFMNDTAQYYFTVIYVLTLLFHIALLYKNMVVNKREATCSILIE